MSQQWPAGLLDNFTLHCGWRPVCTVACWGRKEDTEFTGALNHIQIHIKQGERQPDPRPTGVEMAGGVKTLQEANIAITTVLEARCSTGTLFNHCFPERRPIPFEFSNDTKFLRAGRNNLLP